MYSLIVIIIHLCILVCVYVMSHCSNFTHCWIELLLSYRPKRRITWFHQRRKTMKVLTNWRPRWQLFCQKCLDTAEYRRRRPAATRLTLNPPRPPDHILIHIILKTNTPSGPTRFTLTLSPCLQHPTTPTPTKHRVIIISSEFIYHSHCIKLTVGV